MGLPGAVWSSWAMSFGHAPWVPLGEGAFGRVGVGAASRGGASPVGALRVPGPSWGRGVVRAPGYDVRSPPELLIGQVGGLLLPMYPAGVSIDGDPLGPYPLQSPFLAGAGAWGRGRLQFPASRTSPPAYVGSPGRTLAHGLLGAEVGRERIDLGGGGSRFRVPSRCRCRCRCRGVSWALCSAGGPPG